MTPILAAIASIFAKEGLNLLAGAVEGGKKKAVDYIEKETGIDIYDVAYVTTETELTPENVKVLKQFEIDEVLKLAKIVADADKSKAVGIILAAAAPEIPELILFGMGAFVIVGFVAFKQYKDAMILAGMWFGAFAMYVKGK